MPYVEGATWTTDALYRETRAKVDARGSPRAASPSRWRRRRSSRSRRSAASPIGQLLYAGDDLSGDEWDGRGWDEHPEGRELLFRLAAEAVLGPRSTLTRLMTGSNLVTPDDLGKRVTFQFELPNGFLGEAVGVFERWDEEAETYFVRKKDGTEVRVPARGVRHGKVIPQ